MFTCHICGSHEAKEELVSDVFLVDEKPALVEHIPAKICAQCGEVIFDLNTAEHIRAMLHGSSQPAKQVSVPVFEFA
jgi:YgiT-type zinc finger domain-containing protein